MEYNDRAFKRLEAEIKVYKRIALGTVLFCLCIVVTVAAIGFKYHVGV